jgi:hypothetical protein
MLRLGIVQEGYIDPKAERAVRDLLRKRAQLVRLQTSQILSIENLLSRNTGKAAEYLSNQPAQHRGTR